MPLDDKQMLDLLTPESRAYVERARADGGPSIGEMTVQQARKLMRDMQRADVSAYAVTAERHDVGDFSVQVIKPAETAGPLPVVLYFHGGGWVLGDAGTHARMTREIAVQSQAAVVFVEYACAPEAPFPIPLEQCYRALTWVSEKGKSLGLDSERIAVAGDSAGGNLAAAVSLLAARRRGPAIRLQALLYPVIDCDLDTRSYLDFAQGLNLDRAAMRWFWEKYVPDAAARVDPLASPMRASLAELKAMPPALIITAECDVLRDEAEAFARKLGDAGVQVAAVRYAGALHGFMVIDELAGATQTVSAMRLLVSELRSAFARGGEHPSGKAWPQRHAVGGIITPV